MATLHFSGTDAKVFTPISSALANLPNGVGTMVVLVKTTTTGIQDFGGLLNSAGTTWYHMLGTNNAGNSFLWDDANVTVIGSTTHLDTASWWLYAVDWGASVATERFHWRNQSTLSAWSHENSGGNNLGLVAGPGTGGFFRLGYSFDNNAGAHDHAIFAVWAGSRFADADYGTWTKTSDLYNHPLGHPVFLCELTGSTLTDLIAGSTYSSANSSGTTLTGADPDNWTFDGLGSVAPGQLRRFPLGV